MNSKSVKTVAIVLLIVVLMTVAVPAFAAARPFVADIIQARATIGDTVTATCEDGVFTYTWIEPGVVELFCHH